MSRFKKWDDFVKGAQQTIQQYEQDKVKNNYLQERIKNYEQKILDIDQQISHHHPYAALTQAKSLAEYIQQHNPEMAPKIFSTAFSTLIHDHDWSDTLNTVAVVGIVDPGFAFTSLKGSIVSLKDSVVSWYYSSEA